jgi:hypothetical protein
MGSFTSDVRRKRTRSWLWACCPHDFPSRAVAGADQYQLGAVVGPDQTRRGPLVLTREREYLPTIAGSAGKCI